MDFIQAHVLDPMTRVTESRLLKTKKGEIRLGRKLGAGAMGEVYEIIADDGGPPTQVIKLPRVSKATGKPFRYSENSLKREVEDYTTVKNSLEKAQKDPRFPKSPGWTKDTIPMVTIEDVEETEEGTGLVKPYTRAKALSKMDDLTPEQVESLRELYDFSDSVEAAIPAKLGQMRFKVDIKTSNIIWVDEPHLMNRMGLSRPSFVFMELSRARIQIKKRPLPPRKP